MFITTTDLVLELNASVLISFRIDKDSGDFFFFKESPSSFLDRDWQEKNPQSQTLFLLLLLGHIR